MVYGKVHGASRRDVAEQSDRDQRERRYNYAREKFRRERRGRAKTARASQRWPRAGMNLGAGVSQTPKPLIKIQMPLYRDRKTSLRPSVLRQWQ